MDVNDLITKADQLLAAHKATQRRSAAFEVNAHAEVCSAVPSTKKNTSKANEAPTLCFYHSRYGDEAKKCRPHCPRWSKNGPAGRQ
jgi:hypothetical protein